MSSRFHSTNQGMAAIKEFFLPTSKKTTSLSRDVSSSSRDLSNSSSNLPNMSRDVSNSSSNVPNMSRDVSNSSSNVPSSTRDVSRSSSNASSSSFGASFSDSNVDVAMTPDEIAEFKEMKRKKMREVAEAQDAAELLESAQRLQIAQDQFKKRTEHRVKVEAFQADPLPGLDDEKKELVFEFFAQIELQEKNIADALKKLGYEKGGHYDWRWGGAKKATTPFELFALQVSVQNALICSAAMDLLSKCNLTNDRTVEMN